MERSQNIQMVVHDWDDCAVNTFEAVYPVLEKFAQSLKIETPHHQQRIDVWGLPLMTQFAIFWPKEDAENLEKIYLKGMKDFFIPPFPGIIETIRVLKEMGLGLGVLSSGPKVTLLDSFSKFFNSLPENTYHFIFAREDLPVHKPDPQVFNPVITYLKELKMEQENMVYVGDSLYDLQASRNRGIMFVATTSGITSKEHFLAAGLEEEYILESFNQLPAWFEKNNI